LSTGESLPLSTLQLFQNVFGINAKEAETLSEEIVTFNTSIEEIFAYGIFRKVVGNPMKFGKTNWNVERLNLSQLHLNNIAGLATTGIKNKRVISIDLSGNNIKALPGNITHLLAEFPNLKEIDLSSNPIVQTEERRARITQELHKAFPDLTIITE
jgi:Leucine-rich repeat (LRR) protein